MKYLVPFFVAFVLIIPLLSSYIYENISIYSYVIGGLSVIIMLLGFINYLYSFSMKSKLMFLGLLIIIMTYNKFVDYEIFYIIVYTLMYCVARFLICEAMIEKNID